MQPLAPPTQRTLACYASWTRWLDFAHHDAYAVDPTVYAATYTISTVASPMGQVKAPLGQSLQCDEAYPAKSFSTTVAPLISFSW